MHIFYILLLHHIHNSSSTLLLNVVSYIFSTIEYFSKRIALVIYVVVHLIIMYWWHSFTLFVEKRLFCRSVLPINSCTKFEALSECSYLFASVCICDLYTHLNLLWKVNFGRFLNLNFRHSLWCEEKVLMHHVFVYEA